MAVSVTIVVVPYERFSESLESVESILARTARPFDLVYVDGGAHAPINASLEARLDQAGSVLLRGRRYLSPNEARNLGIARVRTRYVVFVGNDVVVSDGWLNWLLACAEDTNASFVAGVSRVGVHDPVVYFAGGASHFVEHGGRRRMYDVHFDAGRPLRTVRAGLRRVPSEAAAFHCVLVRTDVLERIGGLDERLHAFEHLDFCLRARAFAGGGWFEPRSVVTYLEPSRVSVADAPYFLLRWSRARVESSLEHFCRLWGLDPRDSGLEPNLEWLADHRARVLGRLRRVLRARFGSRTVACLDALIDGGVSATLVRSDDRRRSLAASMPLSTQDAGR